MRVTLLLLCMLCMQNAFAQLDLPEWSPRATVKQPVGYTTITLEYGRPAARGRTVMGKLVKYGEVWRTGASQGTRLTFDSPVTINSKNIPAGTYAFVTIPDKDKWTILLNTDVSKSYGAPSEYDVKNEVVRFTVTPTKTSTFVESLTINFDISNYNAILQLSWENTLIQFPILTGSDEEALKRIDAALVAQPTNDEAFGQAAFYYSMNQKDPVKTLAFIDKALSLKEDWWYYEQKINLLEKTKNYSEAKKTATQAINFLKTSKPQEWEKIVSRIETQVSGFSKK